MSVDRVALLNRHGFAYGELHLAVSFTDGINGDAAKRVTRAGWPATDRLPDGPYAAALLAHRGQKRNPVVVLGASNLVGVDIDGPEGTRLLREIHPERLPRTVTVETGKGWHLWYVRPTGLNGAAKIELGPEGLEVAKDGYLVCPPGVHASGHVYRFAAGRAPWDLPLAAISHEQLEPFLKYARRSRAREIASPGPVPKGRRHRHLRRIAGAMQRVGASEAAIVAALLIENERNCKPPKDERTVRALAADIANRYQPAA